MDIESCRRSVKKESWEKFLCMIKLDKICYKGLKNNL